MALKALVFDCDGVLVDTERDGHRVAFNRAFARLGLDIVWDVALYGELLQVAGGKERMRHYFEQHGWPENIHDQDDFIKSLHKEKTEQFVAIIESGELALRPGIQRIVDEAIVAGTKLAVCSTSNIRSVSGCVRLMGDRRFAQFDFILAGDVVSKKKPDPEIYLMAQKKLQLSGDECVVIEDSRVGMLAALGAGMNCIVTTSTYTAQEDFNGADRVVTELGDAPAINIALADLETMLAQKQGV